MVDLILSHKRDILMLMAGGILGAAWALAIIVRWPGLVFLEHKK
jgi:hypothetical protein